MDDHAGRALDTATHLGATYADVRVVRRREQRADVKAGHVEGLSLGETEGFGVRVLVDGAWGFASSGRMDAPHVDEIVAEAVRIARASARHARRPVVLADRPARQRALRDARRGGPLRGPHRRDGRHAARGRASHGRGRGHLHDEGRLPRLPRVEGSRRHRRLADRAGHHPRRCQPRGPGRQQRRPAAAHLPRVRRLPGRGLRAHPGPRPRWRAPGLAAEAVALLSAPCCHPAGAPSSCTPRSSTSRSTRAAGIPPSSTASSAGGRLRGHQLPDHRQARGRLPLRLGPGDHRRGRHHAGRPGHVRLGRRGRRRAARAARQRGHPQRLPVEPRDGAAHRPDAAAAPCAPTAGTGCRSSA